MSAETAIEILDSTFDLFKAMGSGIDLDLQWLEMAKRLQRVRAEARWSADLDFIAVKLKAHAAFYAATYRRLSGPEPIDAAMARQLDEVVRHYSLLRAHLEQQLPAR
jgi:hypothetical protein